MISVKQILEREINSLNKTKINHENMLNKATATSAEVSKKAPPGIISVSNYMFDQNDEYSKVYIQLNKDDVITKADVKLDFPSNEKFVCVFGKYRFTSAQLNKPIIPEQSEFVITKSNKLLIKLRKSKPENWKDLYFTVNIDDVTDDMKDEMKDLDNPEKGLMNVIKQLYNKGDDDMKKMINKSFYESRLNQMH